MNVDPASASTLADDGRTVFFCSAFCRQEYLRNARSGSAGEREIVNEARSARQIAYFSMEIAVDDRMPTYAGGLGVLAGDMLRSCADLRVPVVGVTLLHRKG